MARSLPPCPPDQGDPDRNLARLYAFAKRAATFKAGDEYEADAWVVSGHPMLGSGRPMSLGRVSWVFCQHRGHRSEPARPLLLTGQAARAWLTLLPSGGLAVRLTYLDAWRVLEHAMAEAGVGSVSRLTRAVLDGADAIAHEWFGHKRAKEVVTRARAITAHLARNGLLHVAGLDRWRPVRRASDQRFSRSSAAFARRKRELLPPPGFVAALARAYGLATEPSHVIVTCVGALLCSAPARIGEVMSLGVDCMVPGSGPDGEPTLELRWPGAKRYPDHVKYVADAMREVAADAIGRIRDLPAAVEGRKMLAWYVSTPSKLYLPPSLEHLRERPALDMHEVAPLIGAPSWQQARLAMHRRGLLVWPGGARPDPATERVSFGVLERHLLAELPARLREAQSARALTPLFVVQSGLFLPRPGWTPSAVMFQAVSTAQVSRLLSGWKGQCATVLQRLGLDPDGRLACRTHALRHLLNDLCFRGGLSAEDTALWSGRYDIRENRSYDHLDHEDLREATKDVDVSSHLLAPPAGSGKRR